jgi:hypothetical protein
MDIATLGDSSKSNSEHSPGRKKRRVAASEIAEDEAPKPQPVISAHQALESHSASTDSVAEPASRNLMPLVLFVNRNGTSNAGGGSLLRSGRVQSDSPYRVRLADIQFAGLHAKIGEALNE